MRHKTKGIILRSVKYGETSLIITAFTELAGMQAYIIKGVRSSKSKRAGLLQVASLLDFVVEHKPNRQLQHIIEFQPSYLYQSIQEEILKNSVAIFSVELLSKLLPQEETMEELFAFATTYFRTLDELPSKQISNFPLFFAIQCGNFLGYNVSGNFAQARPEANSTEHTLFMDQIPDLKDALLSVEDTLFIEKLSSIKDLSALYQVESNVNTRNRILDWYILFLRHHTQHLSSIHSLDILRTILH